MDSVEFFYVSIARVANQCLNRILHTAILELNDQLTSTVEPIH